MGFHDDTEISLAQIAYEAYGENRNWKTYDDKPMPKWEDLKPEIQDAWAAAAQAVASEFGA
jgi:hypothetical protein